MVDFNIDIRVDPKRATAGIKQVDAALAQLQRRANSLRGLLSASLAVNPASANAGIQAINRSLAELQARVTGAKAALGTGFTVNTTNAERGFDRVDRRIQRTTANANALRGTLARTFAFIGGGLILRSGLQSLVSFSEAIRTTGAVSRATANDFEALRARAIELGATTRFTATQAAEALTNLARAGFDVNESLASVDDVLNLAVAGGIELGEASSITTKSLRAFGIAATDATRAVDTIVAATNRSNSNVQQLGQALSFVAPIARTLGIDIETTSAALGILSDAGLQATRAGTGLRIIFSQLSSPSKRAQKVIRELDLSLEDLNVSSRGLVPVLKTLADANLTAEQAFAIFQNRGAAAALALAQNSDRLKELQDDLRGAGGEAAKTAQDIDRSLLGSLQRVRSAFENIFQQAGGESALKSFLETLAAGLRALGRNADTVVDVVQTLATVIISRLVGQAFRAILAFIFKNPFALLARTVALAAGALVGFADKITVSNDSLATLQDVAIVAFQEIRDFAIPIFEAVGSAISLAFGGPESIGSIREFVEAVARGLDFVRQFFIQFGIDTVASFQSIGVRIGSALEQAFLISANAIGNTIAEIVGFFARQFQGLLSSVAGAVAVARSLGLISEESRVAFEDAIAEVEKAAGLRGQGGANNRNLPWTKGDLDDLKRETENTLAEIDRQAARRSQENAFDTPFQDFTANVFDRADKRAADRIRQQREEGARRAEEDRKRQENARKTKQVIEEANAAAQKATEQVEILSTTLSDGIGQAFFRIAEEAQDLASVSSAVIDSFADNATDALVTFAETGKFSFKDFARSILSDLTRVIARLLVVQAISAALGGLGVSPIGPAAGSLGGLPARAGGGPVQPNRSFVVGENGPEIFTPRRGGEITPNGATAPAPVNVQVVNVDDPSMVPAAISDGGSDDAIVNVLSRNKTRARRILGI